MADSLPGRLLILLGVMATGLGAVAMVAPGGAAVLDGGGPPVGLLGLLALVLAFLTAGDYWNAERRAATLPDADRREPAAVAGAAFDRALARSAARDPVGRRHRARVVQALRRGAVDTLSSATGDGPEAVDARLEAGTWTDDPVAAALFTAEPAQTPADRARALLGRETTFQRRARRAVRAIERRAEGEVDA